jgi:hypothetical protein
VPSSENNAVFCAIANVCPLQKAQPRGLKLPPNITICAIKGVAIFSSLRNFKFLELKQTGNNLEGGTNAT